MQGLARRSSRPAHRGAGPAGQSDYRRGLALAGQAQWPAAAGAFERAVAANASDPVYWLNLAHARIKCGELDRGAAAAHRAARIAPHSELTLAVATECLNAANRHHETLVLLANPPPGGFEDAHLHFQHGEALRHLNRYPEAITAYLAALSRKPDFFQAHVQLGNSFNPMKLHEEARECFKTAIAIGGKEVELASGMAYEALHACRWDYLREDLDELMRLIDSGAGQPVPFQLLAQPSTRPQQLAAARVYAKRLCGHLAPIPRTARGAASPRIRVGYLSSDFHEHATAYLISQIFEQHDRSRFEITAYSYGIDDASPARRRIEQGVDRFVEARDLSDRALAERIRDDGIDILLDLKGYTLGARTAVMAFRPSPIQVNYLGYPGTLGADFYDYIIGDPQITPIDDAPDYSEKIAQMPHCYQPNDRSRAIGARPARSDCGLPEHGFVFCSFNGPYKITAEIFDLWCRLLQRVEHSVLWLFKGSEQAQRNLTREAQRRGIEASRLVWAAPVHQTQHRGRMPLDGFFLDTRPVCAHTTASDALWAGVPLITCPGDTFVSRVAASVLRAADLSELVVTDPAQYESTALALARNPDLLSHLKRRVSESRQHCPLFDSARYTRDLEDLYVRMQDRRLRGQATEHLPAAIPAPADRAR
jgi:predicted O-linked N-acetylglucosamine transferase (SPINDLY family)